MLDLGHRHQTAKPSSANKLIEGFLVYIRKQRAVRRLPASGGRPSCLCHGAVRRTKPRSSLFPALPLSSGHPSHELHLKAVCSLNPQQRDFLIDNSTVAHHGTKIRDGIPANVPILRRAVAATRSKASCAAQDSRSSKGWVAVSE